MNEIKITIEGIKELTEAIRALAGTGGGQVSVAGVQQPQPAMAGVGTTSVSVPVQQPRVPTSVSAQIPTAVPQNYGQVPVQPAVSVGMGVPQQSGTAPAAVPTTAMPQEYTIEQLQVAAAGLSSMGKMPQVMGILQQFGIQAMTELPRERYGEFATALREAGAQI